MSNLHKRIKSHEHMSLEQKMSCNCEQCKHLNVNKSHRKIETPKPTIELIKNNNVKYE